MRCIKVSRAAVAALFFLILISASASYAASPEDIGMLTERICAKDAERWEEISALQKSGEEKLQEVHMTQCFGEFVEDGWWHMVRFEERRTVSLAFRWTETAREFSIFSIEVEPRDAQASQPLLVQFMASRRAGNITLGAWSTYQQATREHELFILPPDPMLDNRDCAPGSWDDCTIVGDEYRAVWEQRYERVIARALALLR